MRIRKIKFSRINNRRRMNLNKMVKRFFRAEGTKVGRDGGRVVSNKIYGNRHAIRIQNVSSDSASPTLQSDDYTEYDVKDLNDKYFEDRSFFVEEGFHSKSPKLGWVYLILLTFLVLIHILGQISWIWALIVVGRD